MAAPFRARAVMRMVHLHCLMALGLTPSMRRKGNCYDNAVAESFFSSTNELIHHRTYHTRDEASGDIFAFYNRQGLHQSLGYLSPQEFRATDPRSLTRCPQNPG